MHRRQTKPTQWLIVAAQPDWLAMRRLRKGAGIILLQRLSPMEARRLRQLATLRGIAILDLEAVARVHNARELTRAMLRRTPLILLSPVHPTRTHPDWAPLPKMRAATLARLAGRKAIALGGMNQQRYAKIVPLGFTGWAGISAFRT